MPSKWTKPVVNSVILPAHAQTSATTPAPATEEPTTTTTMAPLPTNFRGNVSTGVADSTIDKIISAFISEAYAGGLPGNADCCVNSPDGTNFTLTLAFGVSEFSGFYQTSGTVGAMPSSVNDANGCFPPFNIGVDSISDSGALVNINGASTNLPEGSGCPSNMGGAECQIEISDRRLKTDIHKLQQRVNGHQLYRFKYLSDDVQTDYVGIMAQDILETHSEAIVMQKDGFYAVNYDQLGLRMTTLENWEKLGLASVKSHVH